MGMETQQCIKNTHAVNNWTMQLQSTRNGARTGTHWYKRSLKAELPELREYKNSQSPENAATLVFARES